MKNRAPGVDDQVTSRTPPARARRKAMGRPVDRSAEDTRTTILDQAERLFADGGYDGTSIREIAARSDVQAAVVGYHFGGKEELFDAVVGRRAAVLNAARASALAEARAARGNRPLPLDALIRFYVAPFVEATSHGDPGWRNFAALMGRLANSPRGAETIARHADGIARVYLEEFARALPDLPRDSLVDGFLYMVSAMLFVCAGTGRWERLQGDLPPGQREPRQVLEHLVPFVVGGFKALRTVALQG